MSGGDYVHVSKILSRHFISNILSIHNAKDAARWWQKHRPLIVQTASLGVNPGRKDRRKTPGAGALLVQVKNNVITGIRRVLLDEMEAPADWRATAPTESLVALQMV